MAMEDDHALSPAAREPLEAPREVDLLAGVERFAEAAELAEGGGLAEDERPGGPSHAPAEKVPKPDPGARQGVVEVHCHRRAAADAAGCDFAHHVAEEPGIGVGVRIDEDEPVAPRSGGAAIAGARDLVMRLEDDRRTGSAGEFRRAVSGVVVAEDELGTPSCIGEGMHRAADGGKGPG